MNSATRMTGRRIPSLDGLRAISIVLVLISHAQPPGTHPFWFQLLFLHADLGVRIFFVISGFLITTLLLQKQSLKEFYIRRARRILPAFVVFLICAWLLGAPKADWPYVLTWTVNFDPHPAWMIGHLWSLSVEEQFYILWPLAIAFAGKRTWTVIAVAAVFAFPLKAINPALHYAFPVVCGPIALGCLLALYPVRVKVPAWMFVPVILVLDAYDVRFVVNILVALCVARVVSVPPAALNWKPVIWLGKISYSLYLFQQLFLDSISGKPAIPLPFPLNIAGAAALATASYYFIEQPMRRPRYSTSPDDSIRKTRLSSAA
ncbi:MAG TPA: acyltransferase [Bryobacteraceae bacterium]|nr:acyltransferase [Bryobacteraceae bacterium]